MKFEEAIILLEERESDMSKIFPNLRRGIIVPPQIGDNNTDRWLDFADGGAAGKPVVVTEIEKIGLKAVTQRLDPISRNHSIAMGATGAAFMWFALNTFSVECEERHDRLFRDMTFSDTAMMFAMHDIGKSYIPREIIDKRGILSKEERERMKVHSILGELENRSMFSKVRYGQFKRFVGMIAEYHHSPATLGNPGCPFVVHIATLADILDALGSDRSYRSALPPGEIKDHMNRRMKEKYLDEILTEEVLYRNWDFVEKLLLIRRSLGDMSIAAAKEYFNLVEYMVVERLLLLEKDQKKTYGCPRGHVRTA